MTGLEVGGSVLTPSRRCALCGTSVRSWSLRSARVLQERGFRLQVATQGSTRDRDRGIRGRDQAGQAVSVFSKGSGELGLKGRGPVRPRIPVRFYHSLLCQLQPPEPRHKLKVGFAVSSMPSMSVLQRRAANVFPERSEMQEGDLSKFKARAFSGACAYTRPGVLVNVTYALAVNSREYNTGACSPCCSEMRCLAETRAGRGIMHPQARWRLALQV